MGHSLFSSRSAVLSLSVARGDMAEPFWSRDTFIRWRFLHVLSWGLRAVLVAVIIAIGVLAWAVARNVLSFPSLDAGEPGAGRVGVIAGHWESDSGAVCPDGLQEVEITLAVAQQVVALLQSFGYEAEILAEYSAELPGYQADALVAIHADSCLPDRSGFKVARAAHSAVPEQEDRLVTCLYKAYEESTGLARDGDTITADMTGYHAFADIAPQTPAAIIEIGYMGGDRQLLTARRSRVVRGIVAGITCFLQGKD